MEESAREAILYIQANPVSSVIIAVITGFAACKSVAADWKGISILFVIVGFVGFFLGQFMILSLGLKEFLDQLPQFVWLFDLIAGFIGSFIVATVINFFKPT